MDSVEKEVTVFGDSQFLAIMIFRWSDFHVMGILLHTVREVWWEGQSSLWSILKEGYLV